MALAVAETNVGVPGAPGIVNGVAAVVAESVEPDALYATTFNWYADFPVRPVSVVGVVSSASGVHSVNAPVVPTR